MWYYYFLDNGGKEMRLSGGRTWRRTVSEMHHCGTIEEAVIEARELTFGKRIEIHCRYGLMEPCAIVEPDGSVHDCKGEPLRLYDIHGNRL